jgi:hypothetical protein
MPNSHELSDAEHNISVILDKLVEARWIDGLVQHDRDGFYAFKWSPKGHELAKWVNEIGDELDLGPKGLQALLVICKTHPPEF